ncbi:MAG: hypothetical protein ACRETO_05000, partial [Gammaproteobacteria bacterium]
RKSVVDEAGLHFDTTMRACEDYDFWFRLAVISSPPALVKNALVYYRQHPNSMSRAKSNQAWHDAAMCRRIFALFHDSARWLGDRPRSHYLYPMLASALITARRLWVTNTDQFKEFLDGHVMTLSEELQRSMETNKAPVWVLGYIALARSTLLKMLVKDASIDISAYEKTMASLPDRTQCRKTIISSWLAAKPAGQEILSSIKYDLHFTALKFLSRHLEKTQ